MDQATSDRKAAQGRKEVEVSPTDLKAMIRVKGARDNNLKNIFVDIPKNKITVITGLSGSGKSTLAFETIYAEGQRRYVESLSAFARNYMEQLKKPNVDAIQGLSPSIAIDQKTTSTNPRSTVGTVTEIYDYMRLLFSKVAKGHCPEHDIPVDRQTPQDILENIMSMKAGTKFYVLAPVVIDKKGEFLADFQKWLKKGFWRARVDGEWLDLENAKKLQKHKRHTIELLVDRLIVDKKFESRLAESLNRAFQVAGGFVRVEREDGEGELHSLHNSCPQCGYSFPEMDSRIFSFNNPRGACEECEGTGILEYEVQSEDEEYYEVDVCESCNGQRLKKEILNIRLEGKNIAELSALDCTQLREFLEKIKLKGKEALVADKIIQQIVERLTYMERVGTAYLSLGRATRTLSGGEVQRIRLASQVGSALVGVLYVMDEPSIGLHPRDHQRLLEIIKELRERGNTVILVEHDEDTIRCADHIIDIGPGAGVLGGHVVGEGLIEDIQSSPRSLTGEYLSGVKKIEIPSSRREGNGLFISIKGARENNLKNVSVDIPLGLMCGISGVSGSGKSTLIIETLFKEISNRLNGSSLHPGENDGIEGIENVDKIVEINQKPIGRTPRSTPATYVGLFSSIRDLYTHLPESKIRGVAPGHFSFNVKGGRCEVCQGAGAVKVEMHFMSNVFVRCDACDGHRYTPETRRLKYNEKSISDVLEMTVDEAVDFFKNHKIIHRKIKTLQDVGLGYITLGQSSTTLSGGEAQRVKLAKELSKRSTGKTLYILDEPTTGLHFEDVKRLIGLLQRLADKGNTVLLIEHNLDVLKSCDYLIDIGPEGGREGGQLVGVGTPEQIAKLSESFTGQYLKAVL